LFDCWRIVRIEEGMRVKYAAWLQDVLIGIESEALRLNRDGTLAATPHPFDPESRCFTRDFAENQLEIVTDPCSSASSVHLALNTLAGHSREILSRRNEILWPMSMPPRLPDDTAIPLAVFGDSESDRRKHLYRRGLAARFGKPRQMICGVHINISMGRGLLRRLVSNGETTTDDFYLSAARHLYRRMDSLVLLTGCAPVAGEAFPFSPFNREPVVSVRNSRGGYADNLFAAFLDLSSLDSYVQNIRKGLHTALPEYRRKGLVRNGRLLQLSDSVFQSEKEFYAPVRLRQATDEEEPQTRALETRGVGYLEIRFVDRDPFEPGGVSLDTLRLIHLVFLEGILGHASGWSRKSGDRCLASARAAAETRLADLVEGRPEARRQLDRARRALESLRPLGEALDRVLGAHRYREMLERQRDRIDNPARLRPVELFRQLGASGLGWTGFGLSMASPSEKEEIRALHYAGI
jgi:glutamate--cysteine ligase